MKRVLLTEKSDSTFIPSFPETGYASVSSNLWSKSNCPILILVTESISKSESMGEDLAALSEYLSPETKFAFISTTKFQNLITLMLLIGIVKEQLCFRY